ncbi:zinc finger protein [Parasphingorhabdus pacifica]
MFEVVRGPVVFWRPLQEQRHAIHPTPRPHPGQQRRTLCGVDATLTDPSAVDWLAPTCPECMAAAKKLDAERG